MVTSMLLMTDNRRLVPGQKSFYNTISMCLKSPAPRLSQNDPVGGPPRGPVTVNHTLKDIYIASLQAQYKYDQPMSSKNKKKEMNKNKNKNKNRCICMIVPSAQCARTGRATSPVFK